eukprot:13541297-Ditylum_brightwellii.AAC.1
MDMNAADDEEEDDPIPMEGKTIREQIMEAGEKDIGQRSVLVTTIRADFKLKKGEDKFNARKVLLQLLHQMSTVDPLIYVQDKEDSTIWANKQDFPSNKEFTEKYALRQENYNNGKASVFIHFKM